MLEVHSSTPRNSNAPLPNPLPSSPACLRSLQPSPTLFLSAGVVIASVAAFVLFCIVLMLYVVRSGSSRHRPYSDNPHVSHDNGYNLMMAPVLSQLPCG